MIIAMKHAIMWSSPQGINDLNVRTLTHSSRKCGLHAGDISAQKLLESIFRRVYPVWSCRITALEVKVSVKSR